MRVKISSIFRLKAVTAAALCIAALACQPAAHADDGGFGSDGAGTKALQINGFGTVGTLATQISQPWTFRRDISEPGSSGGYANALVDSRIGVQANYILDPEWQLVGQVVAKRVQRDTPVLDFVQWAFVSYQPNPNLTLRIGRTSPDLFLLANYRDVGFAYPWVRPNTEFYGWLPLASIDGIDATQTWITGSAIWRAKLAYGFGRPTLPATGTDQPIKPTARNMVILNLSNEYKGLTTKLSLSMIRIDVDLGSVPSFSQAFSPIESLAGVLPSQVVSEERALAGSLAPIHNSLTRYAGLGFAYDRGPWTGQTEFSYMSGDIPQERAFRTYASFGYRIGPVMPYVAAGRVIPNATTLPIPSDFGPALTPYLGAQNAQMLQAAGTQIATALNASLENQRSVSLGLRWDLSAQTALKLQWDYYHVYANGGGLFGESTADPAYANVFSAALDFVF